MLHSSIKPITTITTWWVVHYVAVQLIQISISRINVKRASDFFDDESTLTWI